MSLKNKEKFIKIIYTVFPRVCHLSQNLSILRCLLFHVRSTGFPTFKTITAIKLLTYCKASLAMLVSGGKQK